MVPDATEVKESSAVIPEAASTALSVVVVSFNTREQTLGCLASVQAHAPAGTEVVVVDCGSMDGSVAAVRSRFPNALVDDAGENLGFARGVNRGVRQSHGRYVLLLNPDATLLGGSLDALIDFADAHPEHGVYGGRTIAADGSLIAGSCWGAPSLWSLICFATGLSTAFRASRAFDPESLGRWQRDTIREVPIVTGCLLLARRRDWDALGGMDEAFFLYGEDADFSIRAARHGFRPVIVPDAVIVHEFGGATPNTGRRMSMIMAGKATLLRRRWRPRRARAGLCLLLAGTWLRAALERATGRPAMWSAVWARRADWAPGYPVARVTLFGLSDA